MLRLFEFHACKIPIAIRDYTKWYLRDKYMSHIFPSYTLGQWNMFNFFLYNFIDNSSKYDWKEWDSSKSMKDQFFHS